MTIVPDDGGTLTTAAGEQAVAGPPAPRRNVEPVPPNSTDEGRDVPQSSDQAHRAARLGRLGSIAGLLVLIVFSFVTVGVTVATHAQLSPIDEAAHIDSVFRAPSIVRTGELMLPETLDEISCRG